MTSYTSRFGFSAGADAPARRGDTPGVVQPSVVADLDPQRTSLVLTFNAFPAGLDDGPPVYLPGAFALFLFDDGRQEALVPGWEHYTVALTTGETQTLGASDAPLPSLRVTAALHVPDDVDAADYRFSIIVGEHAAADLC